ncbi:piggyBac transposable element-derived protein 4-like [Aphis craccivora]|uniref:PiggyBac transposable element-derived protein 4-like n=1 Tax=Aphis craccivora TaxID=307492 RepID=A0A6G0W354_APHCR|nr:piggyBac transposable element-derived protein 4-like [Aphis craccivora]
MALKKFKNIQYILFYFSTIYSASIKISAPGNCSPEPLPKYGSLYNINKNKIFFEKSHVLVLPAINFSFTKIIQDLTSAVTIKIQDRTSCVVLIKIRDPTSTILEFFEALVSLFLLGKVAYETNEYYKQNSNGNNISCHNTSGSDITCQHLF